MPPAPSRQLALPKRVLLLDYRFLELLGPVDALQIFDKAEPALLAMLAGDTQADARLQIAAAEAALRLNALSPQAVAEVYRRQALAGAGAVDPAAQQGDPLLRRALFFQAADVARAPAQRARFLRAILDDARRSGSYMQMAAAVAPLLGKPAAGARSGLVRRARASRRRWPRATSAGRGSGPRRAGLWHWLALIDVADPERRGGRPASLRALEDLAGRGRLGPETLHRLATVLDALDIDVPIAIWDAASRTPAAIERISAGDGHPGRPGAVRQTQRCRPHHPARHARAGCQRPRRGQRAGARRRDPGLEAASASKRTPAGWGSRRCCPCGRARPPTDKARGP